jgi:phospholipase C
MAERRRARKSTRSAAQKGSPGTDAAAGGSAVRGGRAGARAARTRRKPQTAGGLTPHPGVEHVVVLVQENHTMDNYFAGLAPWGVNVAAGWPVEEPVKFSV